MTTSSLAPFLNAHEVFRREECLAYVRSELQEPDPDVFARSALGRAMKTRQILSIRNGLYWVATTQAGKANPLLVAGRASAGAVIGFQAALHWHLKRKLPDQVHVYSSTLQDPWAFQGVRYAPVRARLGPTEGEGDITGVEEHTLRGSRFRITTPERTLVDVLDRQDLATDFLTCWKLLPRLAKASRRFRFDQVVAYLGRLGCATTTAKVGYFLSAHLDRFHLTEDDLLALPERPTAPHPWGPPSALGDGTLNLVWNLRIPERLVLAEPKPPLPVAGPRKRLNVDLNLHGPPLGDELCRRFGRFEITKFGKGQEALVRAVLEGRHALGILPTGAGKSLVYQFSATLLSGVVLVISPLVSLMQDQVVQARELGLTAFALRGRSQVPKTTSKGASKKPAAAAPSTGGFDWNDDAAIRKALADKSLDLLFLAPESLDRTLQRFPQLGPSVAQIVVDEAHVIHEWGEDFRTEYKHLGRIRNLFPEVPVLALTATATDHTRAKILKTLDLQEVEEVKFSVFRPKLYLCRRQVEGTSESRFKALLDFIKQQPRGVGIVYCQTKAETVSLAKQLRAKKFRARHYHAGMPFKARESVQNAFLRGRCKVIVATIAFGMGINKKGVRYVVHYGLPRSLLGYVQEIGRAGRRDRRAECLLIYAKGDEDRFKWEINQSHWLRRAAAAISDEPTPVDLNARREERRQDLGKVVEFAETQACLHQFIANHFGDPSPECDEACESCKTPEHRLELLTPPADLQPGWAPYDPAQEDGDL